MKRKPPITFRAYADAKHGFWCVVRVFETPAQMRGDIRRTLGSCGKDTVGQTTGATRIMANGKRQDIMRGCFAIMWLNRVTMTKWPSEVNAHEAVHAGIRYFERRGWPVCLHQETREGAPDVHERRLEERLAYAVGRIAKYITRGLFRHGVWK